ncbi:MAG TPA: M1 family metallopeptidase [Candidatus Saccharimonadales bacterium]|nr:M1 family metallopeptidase [Candidatus Saccharimonadales bacterium]
MSRRVVQLFNQFRPSNYDLVLGFSDDNTSFSGKVSILGYKSGRPSKRITFHQKDLAIKKVKVFKVGKTDQAGIEVLRFNKHKKFDELRLHSKELMYPGKYLVTIEFSGKITRAMNGIYACDFKKNNQPEQLIATQFESHHAREAFPCIDEPQAKATFNLRLITPKKEKAYVSNTPIKKQTVAKGQTLTVFQPTPIMSVYLLAFVVGDIAYKESKTKDGVVVRTYATPSNVDFTKFALDFAVKCLEFYNEYFGIDYPLEKCDLIALPDFSSGAMENWGCITFREQVLLVDPKNTSITIKQYVAMVIAHELAHMWFGNLVTMRWWTDLWLNEGFASWIEYLATDKIFPEWEMWTQFIVDEQEGALKLDALVNTHPVQVTINHPDEIRSIFDAISYNKGSSVIHMLHQYLGAETFREGLRHYLKTHAYQNTDTVDLWEALEKQAKKPVRSFMHAWTFRPGFPILKVDSSNDKLRLSQQRFFINPSDKVTETDPWPIPLLASTDKLKPNLLEGKSEFLGEAGAKNLIFNHQRSGFFRVIYSSSHLEELGKSIEAKQVSPLDRLGILSDCAEASKAGYYPTADSLKLMSYYENEDNSVVWDIIARLLGSIRVVMDDDDLIKDMKPYTRRIASRQLKRLGWEEIKNESHLDKLLRPTILGITCSAGEPEVVSEALKRFKLAKASTDIEPDLRGVVYYTVARNGNETDFDKLYMFYKESNNSEDRLAIASALCGFKQVKLLNRAIDLIKSDDVRLQDVAYWVAYLFSNRNAKSMAWEWMVKNWGWLKKNLGSDLSFFQFPLYSAQPFYGKKFLKEYETFFAKHTGPGLERSIAQGIEVIEWHTAWRERDLRPLSNFFSTVNKK